MFAITQLSHEEIENDAVKQILATSVYHPLDDGRLDRALSKYRNGDATLLGAWLFGRVAAVLGYRASGSAVEIVHIATAPEYRGRNLARQLVGHLRRMFPAVAIIAETDDEAVGFYRCCLFSVTGATAVDGVARYRCTLPPLASMRNEVRARSADVVYDVLDSIDLEQISHLWSRLNDHHREVTIGWKDHFARFTFEERAKRLTRAGKRLRVDLARDGETGTAVGYCICSVDDSVHGELESIYIDPGYRGAGVGDRLARNGIAWMEACGATDIEIVVAVGNEAALSFYERLGFSPRTYHLRRHPETMQGDT
jgi:diamine N-acetyltransferase